MAVSRLDGRGFRSPEPVPRISQFPIARSITACYGRPSNEFLRAVMGSMQRQPIDSLDAARCTTGGDANPDCPFDVFTSMSFGWPGLPSSLSQSGSPAPFGAVAGRRLPLCPLLLASHSFTVAGSRTPYHEAFSFFAVHFRARRRGEIYRGSADSPNLFDKCIFRYPPTLVTDDCGE